MKKVIPIFYLGILAACFTMTGQAASMSLKEKVYLIEESILLKDIPESTKDLRIWIPYPVTDRWQAVEDFKLSGPFDYRIISDKEYGNTILYLKPKRQAQDKNLIDLKLSFKAKRKEYSIDDADLSPSERLGRFLKADRLVPVNGEIKRIAQKIANGKKADLERVRAIYDYIIDELTYSKDDPNVCGIGDSLLTLQHKKGICTDYHSLFISLVRSLGIPAKFEIGLPIPLDKEAGKLNGYHCWAKFYLKDKGWIPVDISEADKHPEKRDYFFGNIDENRVHLASGRDIRLNYAKDNDVLPLNFFIYPYAESNDKQVKIIDFEISFEKLGGGDRYGKLLRSGEGRAGKI